MEQYPCQSEGEMADIPAQEGCQISPTQLRQTFGLNLRALIGEQSVSAFSRAIKMNRTQINRYLACEAWPRPDVLHRICSHFGVDARILLEPLPENAQREDPTI